MKKTTQAQTNPFKYSDTNKRYYTYDYWLRQTFGGKVAKIPIDAGFTCPNIDGKCSTGGCIYCSSRGSGDFAQMPDMDVVKQLETTKEALSSKWKTDKYIPYFQAHTNTYAPLDKIKEKINPVLECDGVVGVNIATRADCLPENVVEYLADLADKTILTVELGLQTVHNSTAFIINRGHTYEDFVSGYKRLRNASSKINICVHLIFGLPGEDKEDMLESVREVACLQPDQVKIHLLHVLKDTVLGDMYLRGQYQPMEMQDYVNTVCEALTYLPEKTVIGRLTGDGMGSELLSPEWSRKKTVVINSIDKQMYTKNLFQGQNFNKNHVGEYIVNNI